jgi:hypothetical protein
MVALAPDFHVAAFCVAARVAAVLDSRRYITEAGNVRALSGLLICHYDSSPAPPNFSDYS